ncbi:MAG: pitrilysin family protein [Leeuwenhoekiella sp.]
MKNIFISALMLCSLAATAQIDRSTMPEAGPAPEIKIDEPKTYELKNGMTVMVVENHKLPRVTYSLVIDNPPVSEGDAAGTSSLTAAILGKGTSTMSKDEFNEEVDYMGASVNFGSQSASASGLSKYSGRLLELLAKGALYPNFSEEEFTNQKQRLIEGLKSNEKSVGAAAGNLSAVVAYGKDHPKGEITTINSVENVTFEDAKNFYQKVFNPQNAYLIAVGDVKPKDVKKQAKKLFSDWQKGEALPTDFSTPTNSATEISFVDMPNAVQSQIYVQNLVNITMKDPDYFPVLMANAILGGGGEGRLFLNLREDKGYTYGAYSSVGNDKYGPTTFRASASVRNAVTDSSVVAFLDEISRMGKEQVTKKDLENAKAKYIGNFTRSLEQPTTVARFALNIKTEDLDEDFYEDYLAKVNAVTIEDVQRVSKEYFLADNAQIIVAGKGSEVLENLEKVNYDGKTIPISYFDKEGNPVEKPEFKIELPEGVTKETVLEAYIEAIGGLDKLKDVETIWMHGEANMQGTPVVLDIKKTAKGQLIQDVTVMGNSMSKQVLNDNKLNVVARGQNVPTTPEQVAQAKIEAQITPEIGMMDDESIELEGIEKVDGKPAYVLKLSDSKKAFYDTESGLKVQEITVNEMGGQTISQTMGYGDYKPVNGIMLPHSLTQSMGPQNIDFTMTEIKVNEGVQASDFKM